MQVKFEHKCGALSRDAKSCNCLSSTRSVIGMYKLNVTANPTYTREGTCCIVQIPKESVQASEKWRLRRTYETIQRASKLPTVLAIIVTEYMNVASLHVYLKCNGVDEALSVRVDTQQTDKRIRHAVCVLYPVPRHDDLDYLEYDDYFRESMCRRYAKTQSELVEAHMKIVKLQLLLAKQQQSRPSFTLGRRRGSRKRSSSRQRSSSKRSRRRR